jgi:pentatricopeptide repeat protein
MISSGCMPNESTYTILIRGLASEGFVKEAQGALRMHLMRHFGVV